jgi:hypothetical protein
LSIINHFFLGDLGFIDTRTIRLYAITESGKRQLGEWKALIELNRDFDRISKLKPQARGKTFEPLITSLFESQGWNVDPSVRASNEDLDVIVNRGREFFLIEYKWEKDRVAPIAVNHLLGKLYKRADTKGMIFSMSGFTKGAIKDIEETTSKKVVILFGKTDVATLLKNPDSLESVIDEKCASLVAKRIALWS